MRQHWFLCDNFTLILLSMERKSIELQFKDIDATKRTATIAHCVYNNIDRTDDISHKGMFNKSWNEKKDIDFLFNHKDGEIVGNVLRVFEDDEKAYTEVKFGNWTLGDDVLEMADAKVLKGASFGYIPTRKPEYKMINGKKVRLLKEVMHGETSLLTKTPANPLAGIVKLNKSLFMEVPEIKSLSANEFSMLKEMAAMDQRCLEMMVNVSGSVDKTSDLFNWVLYQISRRADLMSAIRSQLQYNSGEMKALQEHVSNMEAFVKNTNASDDCIKSIQSEIDETKSIISSIDTTDTRLITAQSASERDNDSFRKKLLLFNQRLRTA